MTSIRRQLLSWLIIGFLVTIGIAAIGVYRQARLEAREIFDYQLQQMATLFPTEGFGPIINSMNADPDFENVVVVQIWNQGGMQVYQSRPAAPPPESAGTGFSTISRPGGDWRIYGKVIGSNFIQVSQPTKVREDLAAKMAFRTLLPLLIMLTVLMLLLWFIVGRGLKPLNTVASAVAKRSAADLDPLPYTTLPAEVRPLVDALNGLLARLDRVISMQRAFIADAAHELRTPLTAIRLQLQNAQRATSDSERSAAFAQLQAGIERNTRLVEQLLTLARSERETNDEPSQEVDLVSLARETIAELAPMANAKEIELSLVGDSAASVGADPEAMRTLLTNLLDNAIRYTPTAGSVEISIDTLHGGPRLTVSDSGPGIPLEERERVFDRFYRGARGDVIGSGLGLAIVRRIAKRHHATVSLGSGKTGGGLGVTVTFPRP